MKRPWPPGSENDDVASADMRDRSCVGELAGKGAEKTLLKMGENEQLKMGKNEMVASIRSNERHNRCLAGASEDLYCSRESGVARSLRSRDVQMLLFGGEALCMDGEVSGSGACGVANGCAHNLMMLI
eukprot:6199956-Pleurochrysis_carterae.AAC.2